MLKVDIKNISRNTHNDKIIVLNDIHFNISAGKVYTILGKNGTGKSTLIKSLTNLLNKNVFDVVGNVFWDNENIFSMDETRLLKLRRNEIRYVLQDLTNNFDPLKKLKYYFDTSGFNEDTISKQLKEFLLPDYKTISNLYPYEISGGMAQRVSLMLAFLPNPKLLILDEPTSAIDYTNINLLKLKLSEFTSNGNCTLIVTQDISFAKVVSDEVAFLSNGTLTSFQSKDLFFNDVNNVYTQFLNSYEQLK
jgi:ABC-type glutathione transport system ATPase component